jgi:DNA-binding transcriptional MocR family regulator
MFILSTESVYTFCFSGYDESHGNHPAPSHIVESLTRAIVEHRLHPGTKLAEQKLADHFGVSRTLVRQALFQLSQNRLIRWSPRAAPLWRRLRWTRPSRCLPCAACWKPR